jgi:hypothetical protein
MQAPLACNGSLRSDGCPVPIAMTPYQRHAAIERRAMRLRRAGRLVDADLTVLAAMRNHSCPRGAVSFSATYDWLCEVTGCARQTVANAIARLDLCHLVARVRSGRVLNGRWRQNPNRYFLLVPSESSPQTDTPISKSLLCTGGGSNLWISRMQAAKRTAKPAPVPGRPLLPVRTVAEQLAILRAGLL